MLMDDGHKDLFHTPVAIMSLPFALWRRKAISGHLVMNSCNVTSV